MQNNIEIYRQNLEKMKDQFSKVLPPHITADKLVRSVINALQNNPRLKECSLPSVLKSAMTAAVLGLEVDNELGQSYIVPYRGVAQLIPGYKGYITLAYNSGYVVSGQTVRENDEFSYSYGSDYLLHHKPGKGTIKDRGNIIYCYSIARHSSNPCVFKVLDIVEVNQARDISPGYQAFVAGKVADSVWESHYPNMAAKTAIRALSDQLPLNVQRAAAIETNFELGKPSFINSDALIECMQEINLKLTKQQPDLAT